MHIHILGICGTFMGGVALLARAMGHRVSGSDANVYPPMSTLLAEQGIEVAGGYEPAHLEPAPDLVVIGNALSRGNAAVEHVLNQGLRYVSGPEFLSQHVLIERWVLAVAGTHGKTTTSSMLAWILEDAGLAPGFLIGGVPCNFGVSARLGETPFFVVEADEYDTAFFDKRSKFVHYRPRTAVLNNLEFDHADIFPDLAAIQRQFHHLVRTVPGQGQIIAPHDDAALKEVLAQGCWTPVLHSGAPAGWHARLTHPDGSAFELWEGEAHRGTVDWALLGEHNVQNALHALLAARHAGVAIEQGCAALGRFQSVKRRLELRGEIAGVTVFDDFAHHPTAIATTLQGLRRRAPQRRLVALLEPRSNTMRMGVHKDTLADSLREADAVYLYGPPDLGWSLEPIAAALGEGAEVHADIDALVAAVASAARAGDQVVIMSNGAFGGVHERLLAALGAPAPRTAAPA